MKDRLAPAPNFRISRSRCRKAVPNASPSGHTQAPGPPPPTTCSPCSTASASRTCSCDARAARRPRSSSRARCADRIRAATKTLFARQEGRALSRQRRRGRRDRIQKQPGPRSSSGRQRTFLSGWPRQPMRECLGIEPGAVTLFAAMNDHQRVTRTPDTALMEHTTVNFHPLENTMTTSIGRDDLVKFLEATGHLLRIFAVSRCDPAEPRLQSTP